MAFELKNVIPWGRSFQDYLEMFALTPEELELSILDCAGGPASFNVEMKRLGYRVISCDPVYQFSAPEINQRIQETYSTVIEQLHQNQDNYVWENIKSPEHLGELRIAAMQQFLEDFPLGKAEERYLTAELPHLPFNSQQFDLALCSHLLFTYSQQLSEDFHLESVLELCRIAREVRIFPLVDLAGNLSPFLSPVISNLQQQGWTLEIEPVPYEYQKGGNQMLRVFQPAQKPVGAS
ncbi:SAM-dependent methyltransferase [Capilliphycus salinus ALCB114379]|uniref:SAM-dependent methyltransferase n=1 Tax=Capilliphycus salinus TaxID=2768948 RepID=UPI0039A47448